MTHNDATSDVRTQLLAAGPRLAERMELPSLTPAAIAAEAGLSAESFGAHFHDLTGYLLALQQQFLDQQRDRILAAGAEIRSGIERIKQTTTAFLDACLEQRSLRRWFLEARRNHPPLVEGLRRQNQTYVLFIGAELKGLGWPHPEAAARLYLATLQEAALAEYTAGRVLPEFRESLFAYLERY